MQQDPSLPDALRFDRICRTAYSEAFLLSDGDEPVGRVDLHYGASMVHALLVLERELQEDAVRALVDRIDEQLVLTADRPRDDFLVTLYRGQEMGVYSDTEEEEEEETPLTRSRRPSDSPRDVPTL